MFINFVVYSVGVGLDSMMDKLSEFSLARKDANSAAWIDGTFLCI